MPDVFDIVEKNLKKKCSPSDNSAVSKQDDCIMNESENTILEFWTRINNAEPKFSAKARALLAYYQVNNANNRDWYCRNKDVRKNLGWEPDRPRKIWSEATLQKYKRELVERHVITSNDVYATGNMDEKDHRKKGCRIIVNFDWNETNNNQKSNVISSSAISSSAISNNQISDRVLRREDPLEENRDLSKGISERREAAPASKSATQGSHSTGELDLLEESAPLPEKPEKPKKFIPPTKEEVRLELESLLAKKGTIQQWSDNDIQAMTEKFFEYYDAREWKKNNGQKLKDWRASLNTTWLSKQHYLPERPVPAFPGQQTGYPVNQQQKKSFREQDRDYANRHLRDPFGTAISDCVDAAIIMGGDPCDYGLAPQFHEEAMKLMQQRKEQAAKGHNITPEDISIAANRSAKDD